MAKVSLLSGSQPKIDGFEDAEELLIYIARVSNPSNQMNVTTAPRLIKYLIKNNHWSPFEMVHVVLEIETTRDIARQMLRHRSFSFQEFSQRYADPTKSLGFSDPKEVRLQDTKNRQNSIEVSDANFHEAWSRIQLEVIEKAKHAYEWAVGNGVAKEVARVVLPEGLTTSRLYMSGSLRSWIHYCSLRGSVEHGTQKEHREIAQACWSEIVKEFPMTAQAIQEIEAERVVTIDGPISTSRPDPSPSTTKKNESIISKIGKWLKGLR